MKLVNIELTCKIDLLSDMNAQILVQKGLMYGKALGYVNTSDAISNMLMR
jgi:hypothetical protein